LYDKNYVVKTDIQGVEKSKKDYLFDPRTKEIKEETSTTKVGAEQGRAKPTDIGFKVDAYLGQYFDYIVDKEFTAHMEADIDMISGGKKKRNDVLSSFWKKLSKDIDAQMAIKEAKQVIETEKKTIKIGSTEYIVRMGPYGPIIEYLKDGKKTFIGLKGYLQMVKKEYSDIAEEDVKFLLSIPLKLGTVDGKDAMLVSGPYGFYIKWNDRNVKIPAFAMKKFGQTRVFTQEELRGFIEYKAATKKKPAK
jgi:topoisomerase IA-like protein